MFRLKGPATIKINGMVVGKISSITIHGESMWRSWPDPDEDHGRYEDTLYIHIKDGMEKYIKENLRKAHIGFSEPEQLEGFIELRKDHIKMIDMYYDQMRDGIPYAGLELSEFLERIRHG